MRYICTSIVATLLLAGMSFAATINVPADYATIQAAIDAAVDGDEIVLAPGTHSIPAITVVKSITLRSSSGSSDTYITSNSGSQNFGVLRIQGESAGNSLIEGISFIDFHVSSTVIGITYAPNCEVRNCQFSDALSSSLVGGIYFNGPADMSQTCSVTNCSFSGNHNTSSAYGYGVYTDNMTLSISNCTFTNNYNFRAMKLGGGNHTISGCTIANCTLSTDSGAAISSSGYGSLDVENCLFEDNHATRGGAIRMGFYSFGQATITNCQFSRNNADTGGAISNHQSSVDSLLISNTAFCGNTPDDIDGEWTDSGGNGFYDSCDDEDSDGIPDGKDNCYLYNPNQADCNGNSIGDVCDIADGTSEDINENQIPDDCECLADVVVDGEVDINDVLVTISSWGTSGPLGDVNYDGIVDIEDLLIVLGAWGPCP